MKQKIAVVGAGIAGLSAAWMLRDQHDVVLYEAEARPGGHADTQTVVVDGTTINVDTGFIVYNTRNYPNLTALFAELGVATQASDMSFGVSLGGGRLEYGGGSLAQLFAQPRNALRPRFWSMIRDLLRFYREAPKLLDSAGGETLGAYLDQNRYGVAFAEDHLLPMGAAIWSGSLAGMRDFPARSFVRFFVNHGLLSLSDRPAWRTVVGGSRSYVARLVQDLPDVRLAQPVSRVERTASGMIVSHDRGEERFDEVIFACHADQALALLAQPSAAETALLGAFRFQDNIAVLHSDASVMPKRRRAWSAWNYSDTTHDGPVCLTYWMNQLQDLPGKIPLLVTLNPVATPANSLRQITYRHPQFDTAALDAQKLLDTIQGRDRAWFAGAWTGWGFHEDGIASAVRVATALGTAPVWAQKRGRAA
jgi:predicted NAD/FAD-binding protein